LLGGGRLFDRVMGEKANPEDRRAEFSQGPTPGRPADAAGIDTIGRVIVSAENKAYVYSYVRRLSDLYLVEGLK
jgi:hypothetical protein